MTRLRLNLSIQIFIIALITLGYSETYAFSDAESLSPEFNTKLSLFNPDISADFCLAYETNLSAEALLALTYSGLPDDTIICEGSSLLLDLELIGTAPYTLNYEETNLATNITSSQSILLNDLEEWELMPSANMIYVITEISDSAPITPCVITPMDSMEVNLAPTTSVSIIADPYACQNSMAFIYFKFDEYVGSNFNITYSTQPDGGFSYDTTLSNIDETSLGTDSTYTELVSFSFDTNTTFTLIDLEDSGTDCITINSPNAVEIQVAPSSTAELTGTASACTGDSIEMTLELTGISPWQVILDRPVSSTDTTLIISETPFTYVDFEAGSYSLVSIEDAQGCSGSVSGSAELIELSLPSASIVGNTPLCPGQSSIVDLEFSGNGPFDVIVTNPDNQDIFIQSGINPGDSVFNADLTGEYFIISVSNSECTNLNTSEAFTIQEVSSPEITLSGSDFICNADSALLHVTVNNGSAPYSYTLENLTTAETFIFSDVEAIDSIYVHSEGDFVINDISDANSCVGNVISNLVLTERASPFADAGEDMSACNKTALTLISSSDPDLSYQWTSNDYDILEISYLPQPEIFLEHLNAFDYNVDIYLKVNDGFCSNSDSRTITIHSFIEVDAGEDITACSNENINLNGSGSGNITWVDNGNLSDYSIANPSVLNNQLANEFILQVESTSNPGCFASDTVVMNIQPEISLTLNYSSEVCFGYCDAEVAYQVQGGEGELNTELRNSLGDLVNEDDFNSLCADEYTITVSDQNLCEVDSTFTITQLPEYSISSVDITSPVCFGDENGSININAEDALQYKILPDITQDSPLFTALSAGTFDLEIINSFGCVAETTVELNSNPELFISSNFESESFCYGDEVTFEVIASGGSEDFVYHWLPNSGAFSTNSNSVTVTASEDIFIQVLASDNSGLCNTDTLSMEVLLPPVIITNLVSDTLVICQGENASLVSNPEGGTNALECVWTLPNDSEVSECSISIDPIQSANYSLTVSDNCSAPITEVVSVIVHETPIPEFTIDRIDGCYPLEVNFTNNTDFSSEGNCFWNLGNGSSETACNDFTYIYTEPGEFTPSLTVTSEENCSAEFSLDSAIIAYDKPLVDFKWSPYPVTTINTEVQFINLTTGGEEFLWESDLFVSTETNPIYEFPQDTPDVYNVCLSSESEHGCEAYICQDLEVVSTVLVYIPTAFSPDDDGYNETFTPVTSGISDDYYSFKIFTRQGSLVFESSTPNEGWDGVVQNSDFFSPDGVYTWVLKVRDAVNQENLVYKGHLTVLR